VLLCGGSVDIIPSDTIILGDPTRSVSVFIMEVKRHHHKPKRHHHIYGRDFHNPEIDCDLLSSSKTLPKSSLSKSLTKLPQGADAVVEQMLSTFAPPRPSDNDFNSFSESAKRRSVVRSAYLKYEKFKPELRLRLKEVLLERANRSHLFQARHLGPLSLTYAKSKLGRAMRRWFAYAQKQHCSQRTLFRRLVLDTSPPRPSPPSKLHIVFFSLLSVPFLFLMFPSPSSFSSCSFCSLTDNISDAGHGDESSYDATEFR
jgi:hypothetical protein